MVILGERGMLGSVVARRWTELGATGEYTVNCIRPDDVALSSHLAATTRLISPSTDAIAEDTDYARTKRIIEGLPAVTIRSGLVDITRPLTVAYRNWTCNPLTPLEWADLAWQMRDTPGIHVAGREAVSRYDVAVLVARLWDLPRPIPAYAEVALDRVLPDDRTWPPLAVALAEYRAWL